MCEESETKKRWSRGNDVFFLPSLLTAVFQTGRARVPGISVCGEGRATMRGGDMLLKISRVEG
jgi:hypothetical protein